MARTSKDTKAAARSSATSSSAMSTMSTSGQTWTPAPAAAGTPSAGRASVGARTGGLGIGSPIYEELVAELGDPAA